MHDGIRCIMFDWGGTLIRVTRQHDVRGACVNAAIAHLGGLGLTLPANAAEALYARFLREAENSDRIEALDELDTVQMLRDWGREIAVDLPADGAMQKVAEAFWWPWIGCLDTFVGVAAVLAELRATGLTLGLVSNCASWPTACRAELARQDLADYFGFTLFSSEIGRRKPHDAIYEEALRRAGEVCPGLQPHEILFVGDTPAADVDGPQRFGIRTALVRTGNWQGDPAILSARPNHIINSVRDIPQLF